MWNQYFTPACLSEALELMRHFGEGARPIAGGTDLVLDLSSQRIQPAEALVDISRLPELKGITLKDGVVSLGAAETLSCLLQSPLLLSRVPMLTEAIRSIAGPQVRNSATLGGNVVNASPAADAVPALLALDAAVSIAGPGEKVRSLRLEEFLLGVRRVQLSPGELVTGFRFALPSRSARQYFRKVQPRRSMAIAMLNLAVLLEVSDGLISDLRIAMGAVAPTALRIHSVEKNLLGGEVSRALGAAPYASLRDEIRPISDFRATHGYRARVAQRLLREAVVGLLPGLEPTHEA